MGLPHRHDAHVSPLREGGGLAHALVGTLLQVGMAAVIAVPLSILVAIYLVEYGRGKLATFVTFFVDVMTGVPSIVAGLFIYTFWVLTFGFERSGSPPPGADDPDDPGDRAVDRGDAQDRAE